MRDQHIPDGWQPLPYESQPRVQPQSASESEPALDQQDADAQNQPIVEPADDPPSSEHDS